MAQFYTLEEAARVLGMSPEELQGKAQQREVRAFLDGGSWRFRVVDVDELARRRGLGSDAELRLSDLDVPVTQAELGDDFDLSEYNLGVADPDLGPATMDVSGADINSDHDILLDDLSLPPNPMSASSSVIIGMHNSGGKLPGDSDVRLIPDAHQPGGRPSDSDVRLASPTSFKPPSDSDVTLIADDTSDYQALASPNDTAVRKSPVFGSSAEVPAIHDEEEADSDFELTPSSVIDALQPDSGSDFELSALEEPSDEFESTPMLRPGDSDVTAADPGFSGINLSRPSDSGINLQMAPGLGLNAGASSIELAPLSGDDIKAMPSPPKPTKKPGLAATPPPAARKGEKDIFDDTDFEVDALASDGDADDKTVQLEAASDFELEEADTGSEVFAIDEDDVDQNAATAMGPALLEEEDDDGFEEATSGEMASAWDVESEGDSPSSAGRAATAPSVLAAPGASAEWGGLWVTMLGVATLFMLFLAFVSMDLVRNLYDFQGNSPASGIVKSLAGLISS
ncbi:Helix-turn-helix domain-containing protein [Singulisphaera sp. GP187]|uniref:helix-turn-helix domain-containing protein n=1 Tax=Singulisphaera sp. GP187 TaxID=1882752 RepID=UPI000928A893|nr:helix-turn-helix domain-containing protein [Singulisphaera sp. GP187]SIO59134.1 Helix-turn-helix domain-containing protein [Singulisphaera sp. GP187]